MAKTNGKSRQRWLIKGSKTQVLSTYHFAFKLSFILFYYCHLSPLIAQFDTKTKQPKNIQNTCKYV